jgi:hypothetical protein
MKYTFIVFFCLLTLASKPLLAQKPYTYKAIGMNLPLFLDNVYELNFKNQFKNYLRYDLSLGASNNTRYLFANGPIANNWSWFSYDNEKITTSNNKASGAYFKASAAITGTFTLQGRKAHPKIIQPFIGPSVGISNYKNSLTQKIVTIYYTDATDPTPYQKITKTKIEDFSEKGTAVAYGIIMGLSVSNANSWSVDVGMDLLGTRKNTAIKSNSHTIGLGLSPVLKLLYPIGK